MSEKRIKLVKNDLPNDTDTAVDESGSIDDHATKAGRPAFKATLEQREKVRIWSAWGVKRKEIAARLEIADETLNKYFAYDLEAGPAIIAGDYDLALHRECIKGVVAAQRLWEERQKNRIWGSQPVQLIEEKIPKLGKKEAAFIAAQNPDPSTAMGELMARRAASTKTH